MKLILKSLILLFTSIVFSQNELINREAYLLKLPIDNDQFYKQHIKETPYFVHKDILQIYTGEKVFIEIDYQNDKIRSMRVVKENLNPHKTVEIELTQKLDGKVHKNSILKLKNPFDKDLEYKAVMAIFGVKKWINTNVYPVKSKLSAYEMWPDPIITLVLKDWTFK